MLDTASYTAAIVTPIPLTLKIVYSKKQRFI